MEIKRFTPYVDDGSLLVGQDDNGEYVAYSDHFTAMNRKDNEIATLKRKLADVTDALHDVIHVV